MLLCPPETSLSQKKKKKKNADLWITVCIYLYYVCQLFTKIYIAKQDFLLKF